jgi:hypothetical protein
MPVKISCKQAVDYISKKEERKLSATQRFALWRHLQGCSLCRIFSVQNRVIAQAMGNSPTRDLTAAEKEAIIQSILHA